MDLIIVAGVLFLIYQIGIAIPNRQKKQEEQIRLHFEEINIRLNRLEKLIKEK